MEKKRHRGQFQPGQSGNPKGKPKGTLHKTTKQRLEMIEKYKITPLEFLMSVMIDEANPMNERIDAAKAAAPYTHPKLAAIVAKVEHTNKGQTHEEFVKSLANAARKAEAIIDGACQEVEPVPAASNAGARKGDEGSP